MGLDMYLDKETYIWDSDREELEIKGVKGVDARKVKYIVQEAIYWRKANAIHKWFVDNVQEGNDDCGRYDVSIEDLKKLLELVNKVLADKEFAKANELLPPQSGFFFGSTDYDEWYFNDLERTKIELEKILAEEGTGVWDFIYHSSW